MTKQPKLPETNIEDIKLNQPMFLTDIRGMAEVVSSAPTGKPTNFINQFKIYTNGSTYRFYWYDSLADTWHYVTATA